MGSQGIGIQSLDVKTLYLDVKTSATVAGVDEVDEIVAAWGAVRPDLDVSAMQVLSRVRRLADLLDQQRQRAFAAHDLGAHEFDVLAALRRSPGGGELTPGQLLETTHVTSGTMSNRLERLARRELITRRPDPRDGRQQLVALTQAGTQHVDAALESLLDHERALVDALPQSQRQGLVDSLRHLLEERDPSR